MSMRQYSPPEFQFQVVSNGYLIISASLHMQLASELRDETTVSMMPRFGVCLDRDDHVPQPEMI